MIFKPIVGYLSGETENTDFITEWDLPAGSFTFPAGNSGVYNAEIDFGDGGGWKTVTAYNDANLTNTYSSLGTYQIKIRGIFPWVYINNGSVKTHITKIIQWGDIGISQMQASFFGASNLSVVPDSPITGASASTTLIDTFRDTSFDIPNNFLDNLTSVNNLTRAFYNQKSTTLPSALLSSLTSLNNISGCFTLFTGYTGGIPSGFLDSNTLLTNVSSFFFLSNITSIPSGLFDNNTLITTFSNSFRQTDITAIPANLFNNNDQVTTFANCFYGCAFLTGSSGELWLNPSGAANYTLSAPNYDSGIPSGVDCYFNCTGLSDYASIPTYWK